MFKLVDQNKLYGIKPKLRPILRFSLLDLLTKSFSHHLARNKLLVTTVEGNELVVSTLLDDLSFTHDNDLVRVNDRAEPMGDDNDSLLLFVEQGVKSLLNLMFTLSIEGAGSLIEEQDSRLADESTGDSDSLLLTTRETSTSFTNQGVDTKREENLVFEEATTGLAQSSLESLFKLSIAQGRPVKAIEDVLSDRVGEESGLLLDNAKLLRMVPAVVNLLDVVLVEHDFAAERVIETLDQGNDGGLSAAGVADQCDSLAVLDVDSDALEDGNIRLGGVVEVDGIDVDHANLRVLHLRGSLLPVIVAQLLLRFHDLSGDVVEGTLNLTDLLEVSAQTEDVHEDLPVVEEES